MVFTKLHAGGKFGGGSYVATGGLHGVGASVVNALSARLDVDVERLAGDPGHVLPARRPRASSTATGRERGVHRAVRADRKGGRVKKGVTGTRIRFWPDRQIFTKDATFDYDELVTRARQTSFIVPGLELVIRDLRGAEPVEEKFRHDGGITEFCEFLATTSRSPRSCGSRAPTPSPRPCRCSTTRAT